MITFKQFLEARVSKKALAAEKEEREGWTRDYASGYASIRDMQAHLAKKQFKDQLFVPKRRDPKIEREFETSLRLRAVDRELREEKAPLLSSFRESPVSGSNKPTGAFWTSSAIKNQDGTYTSDWNKFVHQRFPTWQTDYGFLFEVDPSALVIDSMYLDQYYEFAERTGRTKDLPDYYKSSYGADRMRGNFPWDQLARHFDGVYCFGGRGGDDFTYGWDVESTAWFNTSVLKYKGAVRLSVYGDDD